MSRFKQSDPEKDINSVLVYHDKELKNIKFPSNEELDRVNRDTEALLAQLGYNPKALRGQSSIHKKPVMVVPTWEEVCAQAKSNVGEDCNIDDLFTEEELLANKIAVRQMNADFKAIHRLDKFDVSIAALGALVGAAVDILLVGIPEKTHNGLKAGPLSNYIRDYFDKTFPADEMAKLSHSKVSMVPYDAQDNRNTTIHIEGLSAYYHRLLSLGHDPLLGFIFGVADILTNRMTTIDKHGKIVSQVMENYADRTESDIFAALAKQIIHLKTDVITSMGLPVPLMGLFNLLQFGSIGEAEQTIAEIVQGMYYEGYDFVHFCSMSIPSMLVEVIVRLGFSIKRIKEGHPIKASIPFSLNHEKHPKLETMLFVSHAGVTAINAGKVAFTQNPLAINYPEWIAFAMYSFKQLKWSLMEKPSLQDAYVRGRISEELDSVIAESTKTFDQFSEKYAVIFH